MPDPATMTATATRNEAMLDAMAAASLSLRQLAARTRIHRQCLQSMIDGRPVFESKARQVHLALGQQFNTLGIVLYCPSR